MVLTCLCIKCFFLEIKAKLTFKLRKWKTVRINCLKANTFKQKMKKVRLNKKIESNNQKHGLFSLVKPRIGGAVLCFLYSFLRNHNVPRFVSVVYKNLQSSNAFKLARITSGQILYLLFFLSTSCLPNRLDNPPTAVSNLSYIIESNMLMRCRLLIRLVRLKFKSI